MSVTGQIWTPRAGDAARDSLQSNSKLLDVIRELREFDIAISNISAPDWTVLSTKATPQDWALSDHVFTFGLTLAITDHNTDVTTKHKIMDKILKLPKFR